MSRRYWVLGLVALATALLLSMAGCNLVAGDTEDEPGWSEIDWPDCDKDDRSPRWESAYCGRSPKATGKTTVTISPKVTKTKRPTKTPGQTR